MKLCFQRSVYMAKKNSAKKDIKKDLRLPLIIVGSVVAVLVIALFLAFNDWLPKNVRDGAEATIELQLGCDVTSLKSQKRFRVKDSEHDKETIYLVKGILKGKDKYAAGYSVAVLVAEIENDGEEKIICKTVAMNPDKDVIKEKIKELKSNPENWSAEIDRLNQLV